MTPVELTWSSSPHRRRLVTLAVLALIGALATGRPELVVLAAPLLWALAAGARRPSYGLEVDAEVETRRCFEGEELAVRLVVRAGGSVDQIDLQLDTPESVKVPTGTRWFSAAGRAGEEDVRHEWSVHPGRWGRWTLGTVRTTAYSRGRLYAGAATLDLGSIDVFPHPPALGELVLPASLPGRLGDHVSRLPGEGREFAGIRPYVPGDRQRRINWPVSTRSGRLHVNQFAVERAADVVAVVDAFCDVGPAGDSTLDLAVRGAAGVARAYLRAGSDRVGVVALGGVLRWLGPEMGERQFYRIVDAVLNVRWDYSVVAPDLDRIPRTALPPGALVVMFSPLLDDRATEAARDLRERGFPLVIVDVLTTEPRPDRATKIAPLALRLWRLDRQALRFRLADLGIPVVSWDGQRPLDDALRPLARTPIMGVQA